jgi:hypothetical protein
MRVWKVSTFTAAAVAVLAVPAAGTSRAAPPDAPLQDCRARHESSQPYTSLTNANDVVFGPLILTRYLGWRKPLRASAGNPNPEEWPYVLKTPVRLRAGITATFAIAPAAADIAAILPSSTLEWLPAVRFRACAASKRAHAYTGTIGPITGFGQVIAIKRPSACVPIEVWLSNRVTPIRRVVPIGRPRC